jgi:hypothetical protein
MPYRVRDHLRHTNKEIARFQRYTGTTVLWYEWAGVIDTTPDVSEGIEDLYDEGGLAATQARRWVAPKPMPVYSVIRQEDVETPSAEGMYTVETIHISALLEQLRAAGLSDPYDARRHLFDRIVWDGRVYEIRRYQIQGRLQNYETTVGIDATRVMPEEMINDPDFTGYYLPYVPPEGVPGEPPTPTNIDGGGP